MKTIGFASVLAGFLAVSTGDVQAQDGWSGFYAGIESGIAHNVVDFSGTKTVVPPPVVETKPVFLRTFYSEELVPFVVRMVKVVKAVKPQKQAMKSRKERNAVMAGGYAGYDRQVGNLVIGGMVDMNLVNAKRMQFNSDVNASYDMNWVATARVRAGWAVNDRLLVYATGGGAMASVTRSFTGPKGTVSGQTKVKGLVVGGGAELHLPGNWSLKGEYLHFKLGKTADGNSQTRMTTKLDTFKVGIAYRF